VVAVSLTLALGSIIAPGRVPSRPLGAVWAPGLCCRIGGGGESDGVGLAREAAWIRRSAAAATDMGGEGSGPGRRCVSCERVSQSVNQSARPLVGQVTPSACVAVRGGMPFFRSRERNGTDRARIDGGLYETHNTHQIPPSRLSTPLQPRPGPPTLIPNTIPIPTPPFLGPPPCPLRARARTHPSPLLGPLIHDVRAVAALLRPARRADVPAAVGAPEQHAAVVLVADVAFGRVDGDRGEGLVEGWHFRRAAGVGVEAGWDVSGSDGGNVGDPLG